MSNYGSIFPSFHSGPHHIQMGELLRRFTNRTNFIRIFNEKLKINSPVPVLVFYGVGGSGKTWLAQFLRENYLNTRVTHPHAYIDFRPDHTDMSPVGALWSIRKQLMETEPGLYFPRFETVWSKLWERTHDGLSIRHNANLLSDEAETLASVLSMFRPFPGGLVPRVINAVVRTGRWVRNKREGMVAIAWLQDRVGLDVKNKLNHMSLVEMHSLLPAALAADIQENAKGVSRRPVIIVDTYEKLEGQRLATSHTFIESFAKELVRGNVNTLLMICGQNRLLWAERKRGDHWEIDKDSLWSQGMTRNDHECFTSNYLEQYLIGDLSEQDIMNYLRDKRGIEDRTLCQELYNLTRGYALALGTAVDLLTDDSAASYTKIRELGANVNYRLSEQWKDQLNHKLVDYLLKQLHARGESALAGLLRAASILRWFTDDLLFYVSGGADGTFQDNFERLTQYSFIEPHEKIDNQLTYRIHAAIQEALKSTIHTASQRLRWHQLARDYFASKINESRNLTCAMPGEAAFGYQLEHLYHTFRVNTTAAIQLLRELFEHCREQYRWVDCSGLIGAAKEHPNLDAGARSYIRFYEAELLMDFMPGPVSSAYGIRYTDGQSSDYKYLIDAAMSAYEDSLNLQKEAADTALVPLIFLRKGELFSAIDKPKETISAFEEALSISRSNGNKYAEAHALRFLAIFNNVLNPHLHQLKYLEDALNIFRKLSVTFWVAEVLKDISILYEERGEVDAAAVTAHEALVVAESQGNQNTVARARHTYGRSLYYAGRFNESLPYYEQAREDFKKLGDVGGVAACARGIGRIYRDRERPDYERALRNLKRSLEIDEKVQSPWGIGRNNYELALCYQAMGNKALALKHAIDAKNIWSVKGYEETRLVSALIAKLQSENHDGN